MAPKKKLSTVLEEGSILYNPMAETISANVPDASADVPSMVAKIAGDDGSFARFARSDHAHEAVVGTPVALTPGGVNAEGASSSLARADHAHSLPAFGTDAGTFLEGNDSRLTSDVTSSDLRSATTVVNVSSAAAPTAGRLLVGTDSTHAVWRLPAGDLGGTFSSATVTRTPALKSATTDVNVASAAAPTAGMALTATSSTAASWSYPQDLPQVTITSGTSSTATPNTLYVLNVASDYTLLLPVVGPVAGDRVTVKRHPSQTGQERYSVGSSNVDGPPRTGLLLQAPGETATFVFTGGTTWLRTSFDHDLQYRFYGGSFPLPAAKVSAIHQLTVSNTEIVPLNLPPIHAAGDQLIVKRGTYPSGGYSTIDGNGSDTIDGALTLRLNANGEVCILVSDGSNWVRLEDPIATVLNYWQVSLSGATVTADMHRVYLCSGTNTINLPDIATVQDGDLIIVKIVSGTASEASGGTSVVPFGVNLIDYLNSPTLLWQTGDVATFCASQSSISGGRQWRLLNLPKAPVRDPFTSFAWQPDNTALLSVEQHRNFAASNTLTATSTLYLSDSLAPNGCLGNIYVKQDAIGGHTMSFSVSASRTILKDSGVPNLVPNTAANAVTQYQFYYFTNVGTDYVLIRKFPLV